MEVDNEVGQSYVPEGPEAAPARPVPVAFQEMNADLSAVETEMKNIEASIKHAKLEMEMDRFIPGTNSDGPEKIKIEIDNLDPNSVKAKLREKLRQKSQETQLLREMERSLAEEANSTAQELEAEEMKNHNVDQVKEEPPDHVVKMKQSKPKSLEQKTNKRRRGDGDSQHEKVSPTKIPKHTTDSNQDL